MDDSISMIGNVLFNSVNPNSIRNRAREPGSAVVDDWDCLKSMVISHLSSIDFPEIVFHLCDQLMKGLIIHKFQIQVRIYETHCGPLTQYGMKHMRVFADMCNNGVTGLDMENTCMTVCS